VESSATNEGDCSLRGFEHVGKAIICGKVKQGKKEHETPVAEDKTENDVADDGVEASGRACRQKG
jgi:hypothetical protein